jgi:transglutaminase-like putative cysteine protease
MALAAGTSARAHRLIAVAAIVLLAIATGLAFGRVFVGGTTTLELLGTGLAAAGLAVLFERRSLFLATVVSAAGLAIAIGLIVFPGTTWYGLPTSATLHAALDAAAFVGEQARIQVAPAEPIDPLLLAAVVSLWAAIFSAHALAFRAGSPLLGLVPPVALVAFADTVLEEYVKPLYGVAFLVAAILVVFADGLARVQGWGPVWTSSRRGIVRNAGTGARRVALTALGLALVAPILVPGFGAKAVIDFGTPSRERVAIDPFVSVSASLQRRDPIEVMRVTAPRPMYLRLVALPDFDGVLWHPDQDAPSEVVPNGAPLPSVGDHPGAPERVAIDVTANLDMPWMPMPYPAGNVVFPGATVRYDAATGTAYVDGSLSAGDSYEVEARTVLPSAGQLRATAAPIVPSTDRYIALPPDMPPQLKTIAQEWTVGASSNFDRAMAIQEHLRDTSRFHYDQRVNARASTRTILDFLTRSRRGFCQQFATSMAVLLRTLGVPSRVVVGFASGRLVPGTEDQRSITTSNAHAWVEVRFPGWGWLPFEPTPTRSNPVMAAYTTGSGGPTPSELPDNSGQTPASPDSQFGVRQNPRERLLDPSRPTGPRGGVGGDVLPAEEGPWLTLRKLLLLGLLAAGLVLLLVPPARAFRRRVRLRRAAAEPRRLILVAYDQFTERARGMGLGRGPGETIEEYRRKVLETGYLSDGHLDRLTRIATAAAYSPRSPDEEDALLAVDAAEVALREIKRSVGPTRWIVGLYRRS